MSTITTVESLPVIAWQNHPVITTELLAQVYDAKPIHIQQNFKNNASRFVEGVHYFKLTGSDLKAFALQLDNIELQISNMVRSIMLWTERGAVRHAKILDTEQAWAVQGKLEDCYFHKPVEPPKQPAQVDLFNSDSITISKDRYISLLESMNQKLTALVDGQAVGCAPHTLHPLAGDGAQCAPYTAPSSKRIIRTWTAKEIRQLRDYKVQGLTYAQIGEKLGRSVGSVRNAAADYLVRGAV